jgi:hypothetical protein
LPAGSVTPEEIDQVNGDIIKAKEQRLKDVKDVPPSKQG